MERKIQNFQFLMLILFVFAVTACTRGEGKSTKISVQFPAASQKASGIAQVVTPPQGTSKWSIAEVTAGTDLNCYAIAVEAIQAPGPNSCYNKNGTILSRPAIVYGGFPAGSAQTIEVPPGPDRKISLIGFKTDQANLCKDVNLTSLGLDVAHFSPPVVVTSVVKNLDPGATVEVALTVPAALPAAGVFEDCTPFQFGRGTSAATGLSLISVSPPSGSTAGGTTLVLTGTGFDPSMTVNVGGSNCSSVVVTSSAMATCTAPPHAAGPVAVTVTKSPEVASLPSGFSYSAPGPAILTFTPSSWNYTTVPVGMPVVGSLQLQNSGGSIATSIAPQSLSGDFAITGGTCTSTLAIGASCWIDVTFTPSTAAVSNSNLFVDYHDGTASVDVNAALTGTGVELANLQISDGPSYTYPQTVVGGAGTPHVFTVTNVGAGSASAIQAPMISGGSGWYIVTSNSCSASLAPAGSCTITIMFNPGAASASGATINLDYNNGVATVQTNRGINGVGVNPAQLQFVESALTFPLLGSGQSQDHTFTVQNTGGSTATSLSGASLGSPYSWKGGSFPGTGGTCGGSLANGASCDVVVTFAPVANGNFPQTISFTYNNGIAGGQNASTNLDGTGDVTNPTIISFTSPESPTTSNERIPIDIVFSESVTGLSAGDFSVGGGGTVVNVTGSGSSWHALVQLPATNPSVTIQLNANAVQDPAGNGNTSPSSTLNFNFTMPAGNSVAISTSGAPSPREEMAYVWMGTKMFAWGGFMGGTSYGGAYTLDGANGTWSAENSSGEPSPRSMAKAVYDGSRVFIWGGQDAGTAKNDGAYFDTASNTWTAMGTSNAPTPRFGHTAIYAAGKIIVWGGTDGSNYLDTGARYNTSGGSWTTMSMTAPPLPRAFHAAVWTGTKMLIWGGYDGTNILANGKYYNMVNDSWQLMSTTNEPTPRRDFAYVWTGSKFVVWGGIQAGNSISGQGAMFDPESNTWTAITNSGDIPSPRYEMKSVWTGTHMIISGGYLASGLPTDEQFALDPLTGQWRRLRPMSSDPRGKHVIAWTGSRVMTFGGRNDGGNWYNTGTLTDPGFQGIRIKQMAVGDSHACAISESGLLKCWGNNSYGQLGQGDTSARGDSPSEMGANLIPVNLGTGVTALKVALGSQFTCVLTNQFNVRCFGQNSYGQLGNGNQNNIGDGPGEMGNSLANVPLGARAIDISAGTDHACAVTEYGQVKCWGRNGANYILGQTGDSTSYITTPVIPAGLTAGMVEVASGDQHICARRFDQVYCWGSNAVGQLGLGDNTTRDTPTALTSLSPYGIQSLHLRGSSMCAMAMAGYKCWGENDLGQLGDGSTTHRNSFVDLNASAMTHLSVGGSSICGIEYGALTCWGEGAQGQLGSNSTSNILTPGTPIQNWSNGAVGVASGYQATCAWYEDGSNRCWGAGNYGRLGNGSTSGIGYSGGQMASVVSFALF